jgi:hypothetical protein
MIVWHVARLPKHPFSKLKEKQKRLPCSYSCHHKTKMILPSPDQKHHFPAFCPLTINTLTILLLCHHQLNVKYHNVQPHMAEIFTVHHLLLQCKKNNKARHTNLPYRPTRHTNLPYRPARHTNLPYRPAHHTNLPYRPARHTNLPYRPARHKELTQRFLQ